MKFFIVDSSEVLAQILELNGIVDTNHIEPEDALNGINPEYNQIIDNVFLQLSEMLEPDELRAVLNK